MSIVKDFLLIFLFIYIIYKYVILHQEFVKQREYFIKTLSHDLRVSTLAQIRGLEILQKNDLPKPLQDLLFDINNSCKYTFDMITMLLDTYRFENGEQVLNYETFNLSEIINDCIHKISNEAKDKNIDFCSNLKNFEAIYADKYGFRKIVSILIRTALYYSEQNNTILIEMQKKNDFTKFSIIYKGKSLSDEECRRMFSNNPRFSTVGHGIRMHLCKKIIDFHKGKIFVKNHSKDINSFTFIIPSKKEDHEYKTPILKEFQTSKI